MKKLNCLNQVKDFHQTFEVPVLRKPVLPPAERAELRVSLIQEELDELSQAIKAGDLVEISDALCDLQYVISGAVLEFGLGRKFPGLFDEVHRSNMSKACVTQQEALATISHYKKKDGTEAMYKPVGDKWIVYRMSDNKVLKSINYSAANFETLLHSGSGPIQKSPK